MADFGFDVSTFVGTPGDLDPTFTLISGVHVVAESIARRLMTPRGALQYDDEYGLDVRSYCNESYTPQTLYVLRQYIEAECEKDERVLQATCTIDTTPSLFTMTIHVAVLTTDGVFALVFDIGKTGFSILVNT